jgi:hypothetical protein
MEWTQVISLKARPPFCIGGSNGDDWSKFTSDKTITTLRFDMIGLVENDISNILSALNNEAPDVSFHEITFKSNIVNWKLMNRLLNNWPASLLRSVLDVEFQLPSIFQQIYITKADKIAKKDVINAICRFLRLCTSKVRVRFVGCSFDNEELANICTEGNLTRTICDLSLLSSREFSDDGFELCFECKTEDMQRWKVVETTTSASKYLVKFITKFPCVLTHLYVHGKFYDLLKLFDDSLTSLLNLEFLLFDSSSIVMSQSLVISFLKLPKLRSLDLKYVSIDNEAVPENLASLQDLCLHFSSATWPQHIRNFLNCAAMQDLSNFKGVFNHDFDVEEFLTHTLWPSNLNTLQLEFSELTDESLSLLFQSLEQFHHLSKLCIGKVSGIAESVQTLEEFIKKDQSLESLTIYAEYISPVHLSQLAKALAVNQGLVSFKLHCSGQTVDEEAVGKARRDVCEAIQQNRKVVEFWTDDCSSEEIKAELYKNWSLFQQQVKLLVLKVLRIQSRGSLLISNDLLRLIFIFYHINEVI